MEHKEYKYEIPEEQPQMLSEPEVAYISIPLPVSSGIDVASIKQKIVDYAKSLIMLEMASYSKAETNEMSEAMNFIDSLSVEGGKDIPLSYDGIDAIVDVKYSRI